MLFESDLQAPAYTAFAYVDEFFARSAESTDASVRRSWSVPEAARPPDLHMGHYLLSGC